MPFDTLVTVIVTKTPRNELNVVRQDCIASSAEASMGVSDRPGELRQRSACS